MCLSPLPAAAAAGILGGVLALFCAPPPVLLWTFGLALATIALARARRGYAPLSLAAIGMVALASALRMGERAPDDIAALATGSYVRLEGVVDGFAQTTAMGSVRVPLALTEPRQGRILAFLRPAPRLIPGDRVAVTGILDIPDGPTNPGGFDYRGYLARRGIRRILRGEVRACAASQALGLWRAGAQMREGLRAIVDRALAPDDAAVVLGVLLSITDGIDSELDDAFMRSGTVHILSASGLHIVALICLMRGILERLAAPRWLLASAPLLVAWLLVLATGGDVPTVRAAWMATTLAGAPHLKRRGSALHALCLAALGEIVLRPSSVFDPGAQLSYGTVAALVALAPVWERFEDRWAAGSWRERATSWVLGGLSVSVVAQLASAPLVAWHFRLVSLSAVFANLIVAPLAEALLGGGFAACLAGSVPLLGPFLWTITAALAGGLREVAGAFAAAPGSSFWRLWRRVAPALLLMLVLIGCRTPPDRLRITFLDVGQGDAAVIETPSGRVAVIDGGGRPGTDGRDGPGNRVLVPYLRFRGVSAIDWLVLTHPDDDHVQGLLPVVRRMAVGAALDSGYPEARGACQQLRSAIDRAGVPRFRARRGQRVDLGGGVRLEVLHPAATFLSGSPSPTNDNAVVLRLCYGRFRAMFTADAAEAAERAMMRSGMDLRSDVLKVGHHGSASSTGDAFLVHVHPQVAVLSCGRRNRFGHPAPATLQRLRAAHCRVFRTDRQGAIVVETDGRRLQVSATVAPKQ